MSSKYEEFKNRFCPQDVVKEMFKAYYGEANSKKIDETVDNVNIVFIPKDLSKLEIFDAFKKVYQNNPSVDWEQKAKFFCDNLEEMCKKPNNSSCAFFVAQEYKVLQQLGFDVSKIFLKHKTTGQFKLNENSSEAQKLMNFAKYSLKKKKVDKNVLDIDSFVKVYNTAAKQRMNCSAYTMKNRSTGKLQVCTGELKNDFSNTEENFAQIENLSNEDKAFLQNFLYSTTPIYQLKNDAEKYIVNGFNRIFHKNYTSCKDIENDSSLLIFLELKTEISKHIHEFIKTEQSDKLDYVSDKDKIIDFDHEAVILRNDDTSTTAVHDADSNSISIQINERISFDTIAHEYNHALSTINNSKQGFSKHSIGFNEIVNEFLTQQAIKKSKHLIESSVDINIDSSSRCNYTTGIDIFSGFLSKYEEKLKECQMGDSSKILINFIGENNFKRLIKFANKVEQSNYGKFLIGLNLSNGTKSETVAEFLSEYRKDPSILDYVKQSQQLAIKELIDYENFINQLIQNYQEFEKGNIMDIPLASELTQSQNV